MGRMKQYLELIQQSRLLAPNLKEMTLRVYTGNQNKGNAVARAVVRDHLLALRWMNPNAVIYLREAKGQGEPVVEYDLWVNGGSQRSFKVTPELTPDEVVAKIMMAARDPDDDDARAAAASSAAAVASSRPAAPQPAASASAAPAPIAAASRSYSTVASKSSRIEAELETLTEGSQQDGRLR